MCRFITEFEIFYIKSDTEQMCQEGQHCAVVSNQHGGGGGRKEDDGQHFHPMQDFSHRLICLRCVKERNCKSILNAVVNLQVRYLTNIFKMSFISNKSETHC